MQAIKRTMDILISILSLIILFTPCLGVAVLIKLDSRGPVFYWSDRIGKNNIIFSMPKFRTMKENTEVVASHLFTDSASRVTKFGSILRRYSIDEIPQIYSILRGEMCWVGPRPALFNQDDLKDLRTEKGVHKLKPGITGWAQVNGRDELSVIEKVKFDEEYSIKASIVFDFYIIWLTIFKVIRRAGVSH